MMEHQAQVYAPGAGSGYSHAQLHALACHVCGEESGPLSTAGHIAIENRPGQMLPWTLVACPEHLGAES